MRVQKRAKKLRATLRVLSEVARWHVMRTVRWMAGAMDGVGGVDSRVVVAGLLGPGWGQRAQNAHAFRPTMCFGSNPLCSRWGATPGRC